MVPDSDPEASSKPLPTEPMVTALEAPQSPTGGLPIRRRNAVMTSGQASFQIPFPTLFQWEYCDDVPSPIPDDYVSHG